MLWPGGSDVVKFRHNNHMVRVRIKYHVLAWSTRFCRPKQGCKMSRLTLKLPTVASDCGLTSRLHQHVFLLMTVCSQTSSECEMVRMKHNNSTYVWFLQKRAKQLCHSGSRVVAASVFHTSCPPRSGSAQRTAVLLEAADVKWNRDPQFSGCGGLHPDTDHMLIILTNLTCTLLLLL